MVQEEPLSTADKGMNSGNGHEGSSTDGASGEEVPFLGNVSTVVVEDDEGDHDAPGARVEKLSPVHEEGFDENGVFNQTSYKKWNNDTATVPIPPPTQDNARVTSAGSTSSSSSLRASLATRFFSATASATKKIRFYRGSSTNSESDVSENRQSTHLKRLYSQRMRQEKFIEKSVRHLSTSRQDVIASSDDEATEDLSSDAALRKSEVDEHTRDLTEKRKQVLVMFREWEEATAGEKEKFQVPLEVRVRDFSYSVLIRPGSEKIQTVYNSSILYVLKKLYKKYWKNEADNNEMPVTKVILDDINLVIQPGKNYLVLGPPQSGKTSLLRAISGRVRPSIRKRQSKKQAISGQILYNGASLQEGGEEFHIQNAVQYIDQLDRHSPRLTVAETFEFAFQCKAGGTILRETEWCNDEQLAIVKKYDHEDLQVRSTMVALGLDEVSNTFVGDTNVRGISGGQRRRVTVGEMLQERVPVLCGDEISTGLDARSTYDMVDLLVHFSQSNSTSRVISLLQPSPETVSLFDEVIVLSEGRIIYAGPILQVEGYFASLGYKCPEHMDVADFLQQVSSTDGVELYDPSPEMKESFPDAPTSSELATLFKESEWGKRIKEKLESPPHFIWKRGMNSVHEDSVVSRAADMKAVKQRYANSTLKNTCLVFQRFLTLWKRDKRVIIAGAAKVSPTRYVPFFDLALNIAYVLHYLYG